MMTPQERKVALERMDKAVNRFYVMAVQAGNHPFIEFAGVMTAYLKSCQRAHAAGIDFSTCNRHVGHPLPMEDFEVDYLAEKLDCIFDGRITATVNAEDGGRYSVEGKRNQPAKSGAAAPR